MSSTIDLEEKTLYSGGGGCPACKAQRVHTDEEFRKHHPLHKHGITPETGRTYPPDPPKGA